MPGAGDGEVLVRVSAAGVNRPDLMQRLGKYPPPPGASDIPGLEIAGTIVHCGRRLAASDASQRELSEGQQVCALVAGGGYAEYCAVPVEQCLPLPPPLSDVEAAAVPETFFTVWTNLFDRGRLAPGEWVVVHGGSSGIGTTAIQLARAWGASVIATAGTAAKCDACVRLGAARAVNYHDEDFVTAVRDATNGRGADVIVDIIGGDYLARNLGCLATGGRLGADRPDRRLHGLDRPANDSAKASDPDRVNAAPADAGGEGHDCTRGRAARLAVDRARRGQARRPRVVPLGDAASAHRALEAGQVIGKLVLTL